MRLVFRLGVLGMLIGASAQPAQAVLLTWRSSAAAGTAWSDGTLWNPAQAPVSGDSLTFPAPVTGGSRSPVNDIAGLSIAGMTITANAYVVGGQAINLTGNVAFTAGGSNASTISLNTVLQQDTDFNVSANTSNGRLQVDGVISGSFSVNKTGAGLLRYGGSAKTYTGNTNVNEGLLDVAADNLVPSGAGKGNVHVNTGATFALANVNVSINGLNDGASGGGSDFKIAASPKKISVVKRVASGT
jgi:autotransporter-associated beta strand protein